jgi:putative transposase
MAGATEKQFYELTAWALMPNHVHILVLPKVPLRQITQWIKGRTAREANKILQRMGERFW